MSVVLFFRKIFLAVAKKFGLPKEYVVTLNKLLTKFHSGFAAIGLTLIMIHGGISLLKDDISLTGVLGVLIMVVIFVTGIVMKTKYKNMPKKKVVKIHFGLVVLLLIVVFLHITTS